jgi:hypothetical protein
MRVITNQGKETQMEEEPINRTEHDPWRDAWDAVPRDGPGVFVIDTEAFDRRQVRGRWIDPTAEPALIELQLQELLGRWPEPGSWAVVDQVGVGEATLPEHLSISAVTRLTPEDGACS